MIKIISFILLAVNTSAYANSISTTDNFDVSFSNKTLGDGFIKQKQGTVSSTQTSIAIAKPTNDENASTISNDVESIIKALAESCNGSWVYQGTKSGSCGTGYSGSITYNYWYKNTWDTALNHCYSQEKKSEASRACRINNTGGGDK